jgi:hypothetical protein
MAIDPRVLEQALRMEQQGVRSDGTGGITDMLTPQFDQTQYAEAGALPNLNLDLSNVITQNGATDLSFDPAQYLNDSRNTDPQVKQDVADEVSAVLQNADAGDEEDGIRAVAAVALDSSDISPEEVREGYTSISDLIQAGGLPAVEQFVRDVYTDGNNTESIPEWALPASVFGTFLMNEPGDWRQAILRARGKTAATMLNKRVQSQAAKDQLELDIRKKALDLFASGSPTATSLVGLIGKVTPDSLAKYEKSNKLSDLVPITEQKDVTDLLKDFTAPSVAKYQKSNDLNDLVYLPGANQDDKTLDWLKEFTPESVKKYRETNNLDDLDYKPDADRSSALSTTDKIELLKTYTAESVDKYDTTRATTDLIKKDDFGFNMPEVNTDSMLNQQKITDMARPQFIEKQLAVLDANGNPDMKYRENMLRSYTMLYKQTIDTAREKVSGESMVERLPFAEYTPLQYANLLGLDANDPRIEGIAFVPQVKLPKATSKQLNEYNALMSTKKDMQLMRNILEMAPANVTGIRGEWFDTDAARVIADITPFDIPKEATIAQIYNQAAELRLVKAILNEERFSDPDRQLVRDYISGKSFASPFAKLKQLEKVEEVIERALVGVEFELDGRRVPEGFYQGKTQDPELNENDRRQKLLENILELSNNQKP